MAQKEARDEQTGKFGFPTADFEAAAKKQLDAFTNAQLEGLGDFQEINRQWSDRIKAEASLASDLVSNLAAARSIPDVVGAYQTWGSRRLEMAAEDTKRLWDGMQKFAQTSARLLQTRRAP